jgi:hypothetical protein
MSTRNRTVQFFIAAVIALGAWSVGRAQAVVADFEIQIEAPGPGRVTLTCVRGCDWGDLAQLGQPHTMSWSCGGASTRCPGAVDGRGLSLRRAR